MARKFKRRLSAIPKGFNYTDPERDEECAKHKLDWCEPVMAIFDASPRDVRDAGNQHGDEPVQLWHDHGIRPIRRR